MRSNNNKGRSDSKRKTTTKPYHKAETGSKNARFEKKTRTVSDSAESARPARKSAPKASHKPLSGDSKPRFEKTTSSFSESAGKSRTGTRNVLRSESTGTGLPMRKSSARPARKVEGANEKSRFERKPHTERNAKSGSEFVKSETPIKKPVQKKGYKLDEKIRLNRFLSNSGVCSRREADTFISTGCVTVNGKIVSELGTKVSLNDDVRFNGQQLNPQNKIYLLLNKPKGFVTTTDDPQERKTVMHLVDSACPERIYPVGRLDRDTTGVLLFTNDGDVAKKLTHPSFSKKKIYHVFLDKPLTKNDLLTIAKGIELEDGFIAADAINYVEEDNKREVGIEIHSGKNRIVRRIFAHLGYEVEKLDRVVFAGLTKKNLPRGKWRFLSQPEINQLKMQ